jgi:hypothetical protein
MEKRFVYCRKPIATYALTTFNEQILVMLVKCEEA